MDVEEGLRCAEEEETVRVQGEGRAGVTTRELLGMSSGDTGPVGMWWVAGSPGRGRWHRRLRCCALRSFHTGEGRKGRLENRDGQRGGAGGSRVTRGIGEMRGGRHNRTAHSVYLWTGLSLGCSSTLRGQWETLLSLLCSVRPSPIEREKGEMDRLCPVSVTKSDTPSLSFPDPTPRRCTELSESTSCERRERRAFRPQWQSAWTKEREIENDHGQSSVSRSVIKQPSTAVNFHQHGKFDLNQKPNRDGIGTPLKCQSTLSQVNTRWCYQPHTSLWSVSLLPSLFSSPITASVAPPSPHPSSSSSSSLPSVSPPPPSPVLIFSVAVSQPHVSALFCILNPILGLSLSQHCFIAPVTSHLLLGLFLSLPS